MTQPNLLIIMSDEHDPRYMGAAGHDFIQTPHLDALAARGTRFDSAYTPCPICVPARAAFATGRYVHEIAYWDNAIAYDGRERGWGHVLQNAGIPVQSIGKLHYRAEEDPTGFDEEHLPMHIYKGHGMVWGSQRDPLPPHAPTDTRMLGEYIGPGESAYIQYDRAVTDRTVDWLSDWGAARAAQPFCLFVGLVAPHFPLVVAQEYLDLYPPESVPPRKLHPTDGYVHHPWIEVAERFRNTEGDFKDEAERLMAIRCYYGLVSWLDHNVGRILGALDGAGLAGNTRVIYTSDHGDNVGQRGLWGKSNLYEEAAAVPMVMAGPGIAEGAVSRTPVNLIDVYPTVLENFGLNDEAATAPDEAGDANRRPGRSLFELAAAADAPERLAFSEYHAAGSPSGGFMLRRGRWKLNYYVGFAPELFDLDADPEETRDLAGDPAHGDRLRDLEAELRRICDPEAVDAQAKRDQNALIARHGGYEAALSVGAPGATPVPT